MTEIKENVSAEKKQKTVKNYEKKYGLGELRKNCLTLFNVTTSTFDGAASSLSGEFTVLEMKNIIAEWLKKEAK